MTVSVDLDGASNPDVAAWGGLGLGRGVDVAIGVDLVATPLFAGPAAVGFPLMGMPPGLSLRRTFDNGIGVGVGSGSRFLPLPEDRTSEEGAPPHVGTAGVFVTAASRSDATLLGRATLHVGYAEVRRPNTSTTRRGLAVHLAGQGGVGIAMADTARAVVAARASGGVFVWPSRGPVAGPSLGLSGQIVEFDE